MMSRIGTGRVRTMLVVLLGVLPLIPAGYFVAAIAHGSSAMTMGPDQCQLSQIAFCDTFQTIVGGGREGDLDPAKWSFTRVSQQENPYQGQVDNYAPSRAEFCKDMRTVQPDSDSYICGEQYGESNHWMESMNDNGQYVMNSARIRQPFDFANRTGNIVFDVDAKTEGPHSFWNEVWVTDQPIQGPHTDHPGTHSFPRNGFGLVFNADWCGGALQSGNGLREIDTFTNYQETVHDVRSPCVKVQSDNANHFQIQISQSNITVLASDAGGVNLRQISSTPVSLNFTRGYVHFQHAQYNAAKFNSTDTMTYHWHAIGFDGPILPADRAYEVPDAMQPRPADGTVNLGYQVPTKTFSFQNVNLADVAQAYLTYSYWGNGSPPQFTANVNGLKNTYADPTDGIGPNGGNLYTWRYMAQQIPLSQLMPGTNTVSLSDTCGLQCASVANIDLEFVLNADAAVSMPDMPMPMPTTTMPMATTTMPMATTTTMKMSTTTTTMKPTTTTTMPMSTTTAPPIATPQGPWTGGGVTVDKVVSADAGPSYSLNAPALSTSGTKELLVAFLSSDGPGMAGAQRFTRVRGGGLSWTRVAASNSQAGAAEIWTAWANAQVSGLSVTANLGVSGYEGSITVAAFKGASSTIDAVGSAGNGSGAPGLTVTVGTPGSVVWGVGHDWDAGTARQPGAGQSLMHQFVDTAIGDTSWVQRVDVPTSSANARVALGDSAPTADSWNLAAIAIRPA